MLSISQMNSVSCVASTRRAMLDENYNTTQKLVCSQKFLVQARKPAYLRINDITTLADIDDEGQIIANPFNNFVSDGKMQLELEPVDRHYVLGPATGNLETVSAVMGITDVIHPEILFAPELPNDFVSISQEVLRNKPVEVKSRRIETVSKQIEQRVYVSIDDSLIMRISEFTENMSQPLHEIVRTDFTDWEFNMNLDLSLFDTIPPSDGRVFDKKIGFTE